MKKVLKILILQHFPILVGTTGFTRAIQALALRARATHAFSEPLRWFKGILKNNGSQTLICDPSLIGRDDWI